MLAFLCVGSIKGICGKGADILGGSVLMMKTLCLLHCVCDFVVWKYGMGRFCMAGGITPVVHDVAVVYI